MFLSGCERQIWPPAKEFLPCHLTSVGFPMVCQLNCTTLLHNMEPVYSQAQGIHVPGLAQTQDEGVGGKPRKGEVQEACLRMTGTVLHRDDRLTLMDH